MADTQNSVSDATTEIRDAAAAVAAAATGPAEKVTHSKWYLWRKSGTALISAVPLLRHRYHLECVTFSAGPVAAAATAAAASRISVVASDTEF